MIIVCGPGDVTKTKLDVIVVPVNTEGVMGCGLALWAKLRYPVIFESYRKLCREGIYGIGDIALYKVGVGKWVLLFPTKSTWADPAKMSYIEAGLKKFVAMVEAGVIRSASFPALGCGYGQLDFNKDVKPILYRYLDPLEIPVEILLYQQKNKRA